MSKDSQITQSLPLSIHETTRIMRLDKDLSLTRRVSQEAAILVSHATELFVDYIINKSCNTTTNNTNPDTTPSETKDKITGGGGGGGDEQTGGEDTDQGRKEVDYDDVKKVVYGDERLEFLRPVFP